MTRFLAILAIFAASAAQTFGVLGPAWHIPDNPESCLGNSVMRVPVYEIGPTTAVKIYQGVWKGGGANQTGGALWYRNISGTVTSDWSSVPLSWDSNCANNNQYWTNSLYMSAFATNAIVQYYISVVFDNPNQTVYVFGKDSSSSTGDVNAARAEPFSIRNRPAWIWHANNRVVSGNNVQFWTKAGYVSKDGALPWVDNGAIYYTTNGNVPGGSLGVATNGSTSVVPLVLSQTENDPSIAGNAMWWVGTITNLPTFTTIRYRIGLWNSGNNEEKFGDYNTSGTNNNVFSFSIGNVGDPVLAVNGLNANYTTTKLFVNEVAGDSIPLTIIFEPGVANVETAEVFSNLNRRDFAGLDANSDGIEDGILPPDGNLISTNDANHYYRAYRMTESSPGAYQITLNATNTGAYRLTARYKVTGNENWFWYSSNGRRDHAIVVSPKKARDIVMYELNTLTVSSAGTLQGQRSTFEDLHGGAGATHTNRFNLDYAQGLGINWLWFQPIHPQGIAGREIDPATGQPYEVGSPYAVKNFFEIMELMSKGNNRPASMHAFTNFVAAADAQGINIMLDAAFNHTAHDVEAAPLGNSFGWGANPTNQIRHVEARFFSRAGDYCDRASSAANIAVAPDRGDFGKWNDVYDVYFGRYASLVCQNPSDNGNYLNEGDWFNYSDPNWDAITRNVWKYFAEYILYWLDKTGHPAGTPKNQSYKGIDGLRADFAQGLPPQAWEYIINKARARKWDFVFMAETLDGGAPGYRSNRHFDILNENIIFAIKGASHPNDYRSIYEQRRQSYGQGLILLNTVSHDEENYVDPWEALIRYAASSTIDGAPMIFMGQELGISRDFGFDRYEINFGKKIPHFKKFNSMMPIWSDTDFGNDQLYPVYAAINHARHSSPALRSSLRWFINQTTGSAHSQIYSVAKYQTPNGSPATTDVVFAFVNLARNADPAGTFNVNITQNGQNLFGIKPHRMYNVRNIAAYSAHNLSGRSNEWLWGSGRTGTDVLNNGVFVSLNRVPTTTEGWTNSVSPAPYEAQYLKLYDVTPPPAPSASASAGKPTGSNTYVITNDVTFTWSAADDPEGNVVGYRVLIGTSPGADNVANVTVGNVTNYTVNASFGQTLYACVAAINSVGMEGPTNCNAAAVFVLNPDTDDDGDGMINLHEDSAGTDPLDVASVFRVRAVNRLPNGDTEIVWDSVVGKQYAVQATDNLLVPYASISATNVANSTASSYTNSAATPARFYRVILVP
jgi:hypothetical protein